MENGLKVGLIGFTTDFINRWERPSNLENFTVSDTASAVKAVFDKVRPNCDILIGIYHGGFEYDLDSHTELSKTSENIAYKICRDFDFDILLTGHQHMPLSGQEIHGTYIAQTPHNGTKFLELNLEIDDENNKKFSSTLKSPAETPKNG